MTPVDRGETGIYERLAGDSALATLLGAAGGDSRIVWGWPHELLDDPAEGSFPLLTYQAVAGRTALPSEISVQIDEWVWPEGASGGLPRIADVDTRIVELLDERTWSAADGTRLYAFNVTAIPHAPEGPGLPLRRTRRMRVSVG